MVGPGQLRCVNAQHLTGPDHMVSVSSLSKALSAEETPTVCERRYDGGGCFNSALRALQLMRLARHSPDNYVIWGPWPGHLINWALCAWKIHPPYSLYPLTQRHGGCINSCATRLPQSWSIDPHTQS